MGSGASVNLAAERDKPLDLSDVSTPRGESVKAELIRLRAIIKTLDVQEVVFQEEAEEAEPESVGNSDERKKNRRKKAGPGTTRSGRKGSVLTMGMMNDMCRVVGEVSTGYVMSTESIDTDTSSGSSPDETTETSDPSQPSSSVEASVPSEPSEPSKIPQPAEEGLTLKKEPNTLKKETNTKVTFSPASVTRTIEYNTE